MVVGHHQAVGRDERAGAAAVEADAGALHVLEPVLGRGSKLYFSLSSLVGGLLNSHMPSSAEAPPGRMRLTKTKPQSGTDKSSS